MSGAPAFYGHPHVPVPPLEVEIVRVDTKFGPRFEVHARDDKGEMVPLIRDELGCTARYVTLWYARRALWRDAARWIGQGLDVNVVAVPEE